MFGLFRLIAALLVIATHIGGIPFVAGAAVWGFFMLSGLLMAATLHSRHGLGSQGLASFLMSRAVRLYPMYWLSLIFSGLLLWLVAHPELALHVNTALKIPSTTGEWASNLLILGQTSFGLGRAEASLSPSAWAIDVEILMYFCSCLFLARSARIAIAALVLLCLVFPVLWWIARGMVHAGQLSLASQLLYSFLPAALLPYAVGTVMWFKREKLKAMGIKCFTAGVIGLLICTLIVHPRSVSLAYLLVIPSLSAIIGALMYWPKATWGRSPLLQKIDSFAGHMSYPLYLVQWTCAFVFVLLVPENWGWISLEDSRYMYSDLAFVSITALALLVSALCAWLVEWPLDKRRHAILKSLPIRT